MAKILYIIAGPNGAGKTTASYNLLPDLWNCREFVNADEIARGLSPLNPDEMAIEAGRLQLMRIETLLRANLTFAIETTLATRTYQNLINRAQERGYEVEIIFFYLPSAEDAIRRVALRVKAGGHNIPEKVIRRRYAAGLKNLFQLYMPIVNRWSIYNNIEAPSLLIAKSECIEDIKTFERLKELYGK